MGTRRLRWGSWIAFSAFALASCSLDDRPLNYEYHAQEAAGASASGSSGAGIGDAGGPINGAAGSPAVGGDGGDGGSGKADAGSPPAGGNANAAGGSDGSANAGAPNSSAGSGGATSAAAGGRAGGAASSSAGAGPVFACGDLNHDLVDDCSQTLVQNSRFDSSLAHWDAESEMTETWSRENASSASGSGSLMVTHSGPGASMTGAHQCIPVTPNASYDVAARVQVGAGQSGTAGINVYFFDDDACQGNFVPPGNTLFQGGVAGSWTELATSAPLWVPGPAHSMYVRLVANKPPPPTTPLTVLIDDVLVAKRVMP